MGLISRVSSRTYRSLKDKNSIKRISKKISKNLKMADFMDKVKECTVKCRYFQEFGFTLGFTLFAFGGGYSAWKFAMTYAVFYHTMKATFENSRAMLNPAVAFAEFMQKRISIGEYIMFWFAQSFGAFFGFGILN